MLNAWSYCRECDRWFYDATAVEPTCPVCLHPGEVADGPGAPEPPASLAG